MKRVTVVLLAALGVLAGCSSVKIVKAKADSEGIPFYLPRPYVQVYEPFVIASNAYLVSGRLSPDGQYLLIDNSTSNLGGTLFADIAKDSPTQVPVGRVRFQAAVPTGRPQADDAAPAPAGAASAPAGAASTPSAPSTPSSPVGQFNVSVTQSDSPFPATLGRRFFDVVWMPDFDEKYVVQGTPGLGNANIGVTMVQGWGLYGLDARIDNSAVVKPLLDFYSGGLGALTTLAKSKIAPAAALGAPQAGDGDARGITPGSRVSVKVTKVKVVAPGLYPILKPSENLSNIDGVNPNVLKPERPYTNIAFNIYGVLVIEAAKPTGDTPMNLQRYFDVDAQGNPIVQPPAPSQGGFNTTDFEAQANKVLAARKSKDQAIWVLSGTTAAPGQLKTTATLTGGTEKPETLATAEQLKSFLAIQSGNRFPPARISVDLK